MPQPSGKTRLVRHRRWLGYPRSCSALAAHRPVHAIGGLVDHLRSQQIGAQPCFGTMAYVVVGQNRGRDREARRGRYPEKERGQPLRCSAPYAFERCLPAGEDDGGGTVLFDRWNARRGYGGLRRARRSGRSQAACGCRASRTALLSHDPRARRMSPSLVLDLWSRCSPSQEDSPPFKGQAVEGHCPPRQGRGSPAPSMSACAPDHSGTMGRPEGRPIVS
jgi:hypothetical protein